MASQLVEFGELTHDGENKPYAYHGDVEQVPDIRRVEDGSGIAPLTQLVVEEGREPDVEEDFGRANLGGVPLHKHRVVQEEKGHEEDDLKALEVSGNSKTRKRVGCCLVVETGPLLRVNREF